MQIIQQLIVKFNLLNAGSPIGSLERKFGMTDQFYK